METRPVSEWQLLLQSWAGGRGSNGTATADPNQETVDPENGSSNEENNELVVFLEALEAWVPQVSEGVDEQEARQDPVLYNQWKKFEDPASGRRWWWNAADEDWVWEDDMIFEE